MMTTWDCPEARIALGVYVLGAIDPGERALMDAHLDTCEECRAELAELAELPGLLAMVPAEEAIALAEGLLSADGPGEGLRLAQPAAAPTAKAQAVPAQAVPTAAELTPAATASAAPAPEEPERPANVVDLAAARRRRRGLAGVGAAAAAAVVIAGASFGGARLAASTSPAPAQVTVPDQHPAGTPSGPWQTARGGNGQAAATIAYRPMGWGVQLESLVRGIPLNTPCSLEIVKQDGTKVVAGGWTTDEDEGAVYYPSSAAVFKSDVKAFMITIKGEPPITITPA
jgi:anti-sigma factor RsiW